MIMNKKVVLLVVAVIAVVVVIWIGWPPKPPKFMPKFMGEVPAAESVDKGSIKGVKIFCDASGSMKGYVDFGGIEGMVDKNIISNVSTLATRVSEMESSPKFAAKCGSKSWNDNAKFINSMRQNGVFQDGQSFVWELVDDAVGYASDSTVSVVLSDMVLSYGKKAIIQHKDLDYNLHHLDELKGEMILCMGKAKEKKLDVLIIQYFSQFNGRYYYNCRENLVDINSGVKNQFDGKKMESRPYYMMFIGTEKNLRTLIAEKCYAEHEKMHMYATFVKGDITLTEAEYDVEYVVKKGTKPIWAKGKEKQSKYGAGFYLKYIPAKEETASFTITSNDFRLAPYYYKDSQSFEAICEGPARVRSVVFKDNKLTMTLTTDPIKKPAFDIEKRGKFDITIYAKNDWVAESSTDNDYESGMDESNVEKKTWGLKYLVDGINEAYQFKQKDAKVGTLTINYY